MENISNMESTTNFGKLLRGLVALAVAVGLGTFIGWLVSRQGDVTPIAVPASSNPMLAVAPPPAARVAAPDATPVVHRQVHPSIAGQPAEANEHWEQDLDDILLSSDDENTKADRILALIPTAPADHEQELAQHLVNMVQDDHYDGTAQMLTNSTTPVEVSDVLMNDLLNRGNNLKLPMLLAIARNDSHPLKDQALDLLGLLTQEDNGTNWDQWSTAVDTWLQNNSQ